MNDQKRRRYRRWTEDEVLQEIRMLSDRSAKRGQREFPSLYGACIRLFGSWKQAVETAGFPYSEVMRRKTAGYWTKERLVATVRELPEKHSSHVRKIHPDLYSAALRLFGSWELLIRATGFDYQLVRRAWRTRSKKT